MDWEQLRETTLSEVGEALVTEGGGVAGGFVGAAFLGRQIQNAVMPDANIAGNITNAAIAWASNNVPKLAAWYLTRGYAIAPGETATPIREAVSDARKAFAGSVVFDTLMRLANSGSNPASATIMGWQVLGSGSGEDTSKNVQSAQADIQRLIQENSALRTELNKALQRLASPPIPVGGGYAQPAAPVQVNVAPVQPYAAQYAESAPPGYAVPPTEQYVRQRQRKYGFAADQVPAQRQKKYGFMGEDAKEIGAMFGML